MKIEEVFAQLDSAEGYMITVSILKTKGGDIDHFLFTEKFPTVDMLPSHGEVERLVIAELKKPNVANIAPITVRGKSESNLGKEEAPS
jgi:hypothetical protein